MKITPQAFVTTYAIGNEKGFAVGKWFDLTEYADKNDFIDAATKYAKEVLGDEDPELCFSDYECDPLFKDMISECHIDEDLWEAIDVADDYDLDMVAAYIAHMGTKGSFEETCQAAEDAYRGQYDDVNDYAWEYLEDAGYVGKHSELPDIIANNIDIDGVAEWLMQDMFYDDGYLFYAH